MADALLPAILDQIHALLADKAYDALERVLAVLAQAGVTIVIPPKSNRLLQRVLVQITNGKQTRANSGLFLTLPGQPPILVELGLQESRERRGQTGVS